MAEICPECGVSQPDDGNGDRTDATSETPGPSDGPITCGSCDEHIEKGTVACPHCGYSARSNMRKRGILIGAIGLGLSMTVYGLVIGIPLIVWAFKRLQKATSVSAAYTTSDGTPFKTLGS